MASDSALREEVERQISEELDWPLDEHEVHAPAPYRWEHIRRDGPIWNALVDARVEVRQLRERVKELEGR